MVSVPSEHEPYLLARWDNHLVGVQPTPRPTLHTYTQLDTHLQALHIIGKLHDVYFAAGRPHAMAAAAAAAHVCSIRGQHPEGGPVAHAPRHLDARLDADLAGRVEGCLSCTRSQQAIIKRGGC